MIPAIDDVRNALSQNFGTIANSLFPISYAHYEKWSNEEQYLNNLYKAINASNLAKGILIVTAQSSYSLTIECEKIHRTVWVDFLSNGISTRREIGDILLVAKYRDSQGILSRCSCFVQVKVSEKRLTDAWKIEKKQLEFYSKWPLIQACYTQYFRRKFFFAKNLMVSYNNRLFSPYLLLGRTWNTDLLCGPSAWITGSDLISSASLFHDKIRGPLEIPFFNHLLQMLFQATGENDYLNYQSQNQNVSGLVNSLISYVHLNDPPEGKGKPFLVIALTVKSKENKYEKHIDSSYPDKK
jgi:hypothetical protein